MDTTSTRVQRDWLLETFGGREAFVQAHLREATEEIIVDWTRP